MPMKARTNPVEPRPVELIITMTEKELKEVKEMAAYNTAIPNLMAGGIIGLPGMHDIKPYVDTMRDLLMAICKVNK